MYNYDHGNDHYKVYSDLKSSDVKVQKIKYVNSNINVNGIDITEIPPDGTTAAEAAENEGGAGANSQNDKGLEDKINFDRNLVNVCANINDNEQTKISSPKDANLLVTKTVTCDDFSDESVPSVQQDVNPCPVLEATITEDQFVISVTGNNPVPPQFQGSEGGQNVVMGAGFYTVTETSAASVAMDISTLEGNLGIDITGPTASFAEDCTQSDPLEATGTITAGQSQTCKITNHFIIEESQCINSDINFAC